MLILTVSKVHLTLLVRSSAELKYHEGEEKIAQDDRLLLPCRRAHNTILLYSKIHMKKTSVLDSNLVQNTEVTIQYKY